MSEVEEVLHQRRIAALDYTRQHLQALAESILFLQDRGVLPTGSRVLELRQLLSYAGSSAPAVAESMIARECMKKVVGA